MTVRLMEVCLFAFELDLIVSGKLHTLGDEKEFEVLAVHEDTIPRVEHKHLVPLLEDDEQLFDKAVQQDIDEPLDDEGSYLPQPRRRWNAGRDE